MLDTFSDDLHIPKDLPIQVRSKKSWYIAVLIICVVIFLMIAFLLQKQRASNNAEVVSTSLVEEILTRTQPSPTPFPFNELTIPYLREKKHESSLGSLEKVGENQNYSSFLTSYQSDGLKINGLLTEPKGEKPVEGWPAIVFVHGYIPPTIYQTQSKYVEYVDYLARNGFVVFKIDLRGHDQSEGEPGGAYYSSDYVVDTLNARSALQQADFVNPEKVGLWGHSMAGNVTLRSFAAKPEIPAIVIWAGAVFSYTDREKYGINDNSYRPPEMSTSRQRKREQLFAAHGQFDANSPFWRLVAPTNYLNDLKGAIQLHHAINDDVVDIRYSRNLNDLLDSTQVPHELYEYEGGGHNITGASFSQAMRRTVEFFQKHL